MRKKTHEEFVLDFYSKHSPGEYTVLGKYFNSKTPILVRHNICGNEYHAMPYNLYMGKGCKGCNIPNKITHKEFVATIKEK